MHGLDWTILGVFVLWAIVSGLRSRRQASLGLEEFFLAGLLSMAATQFAADTPLLVMGLIATTGVFG